MSRYIDADALTKEIKQDIADEGLTERYVFYRINEAPSIDIVRCKDCRYCKKKRGTFRGEPMFFYRCAEHSRDVESDDFCSYGERRE